MKNVVIHKLPPDGGNVDISNLGGFITWRLFEVFRGDVGAMATALGITTTQLLHIRKGKHGMSPKVRKRFNEIDPDYNIAPVNAYEVTAKAKKKPKGGER